MRISKQGITFNYNNDEITWVWWWMRAKLYGKYLSLIYDDAFPSMSEYFVNVGRVDEPLPFKKIKGFTTEDILLDWIKLRCRVGYYVVLHDVNPEAKPATFWRSIPDNNKMELIKDVILLKCKDHDEVESLCEAMTTNFAKATGIHNGYTIARKWTDD